MTGNWVLQEDSASAAPLLAAGQLRGNKTSFVEQHRIRAYEVGPDQRTTIVTIANLLQVFPFTPAPPPTI